MWHHRLKRAQALVQLAVRAVEPDRWSRKWHCPAAEVQGVRKPADRFRQTVAVARLPGFELQCGCPIVLLLYLLWSSQYRELLWHPSLLSVLQRPRHRLVVRRPRLGSVAGVVFPLSRRWIHIARNSAPSPSLLGR